MAKTSDVREPEFKNEVDTLVVPKKADEYRDDILFDNIRMNVIVLSYNRPRMLGEAIESIITQDYPNICLWIVDDGSDFGVADMIDSYSQVSDKDMILLMDSKLPPEARIARSRISYNINSVLDEIPKGELVTYLCDDDLLAPKWVRRASMALSYNPHVHIANGEVYWFNDGDDWRTDSIYGMPGIPSENKAYWATGSTVHRSDCYHDEEMKWYDNTYIHSQDTSFINDIWDKHPDYLFLSTPAMYHREHKHTLSSKLGRKDEHGRYKEGFIPGKATAQMVSGLMEE